MSERPCHCNQYSEDYQPSECKLCWNYYHVYEVFIAQGGNAADWGKIQLQNKLKKMRQQNPPKPRECGCSKKP